MIFDLHVHTIYSDGLFSPKEVINLARKKGLNGIAITDHDTVKGIYPALNISKNLNEFQVIPGVEFGTIFEDEEVHLLGYFIDYTSKKLLDALNMLKENRIKRGIKIVEKLNSLGMKLSIHDIKKFVKDDYIGRPHIGKALVEKGYVMSLEEAFEKFLDKGKPAYVQRKTLTLKETIDLIHEVNGIAILAHPGLLKNKNIINKCIQFGIDGLEAIHSKHSANDVRMCIKIARMNNLIITGGSDCHGKIINGDYLIGKYYVNINHIPKMKGRL